jgi:hypothetical protein
MITAVHWQDPAGYTPCIHMSNDHGRDCFLYFAMFASYTSSGLMQDGL